MKRLTVEVVKASVAGNLQLAGPVRRVAPASLASCIDLFQSVHRLGICILTLKEKQGSHGC